MPHLPTEVTVICVFGLMCDKKVRRFPDKSVGISLKYASSQQAVKQFLCIFMADCADISRADG